MFLAEKFSDLEKYFIFTPKKDVDERYYHCRNKLWFGVVGIYVLDYKEILGKAIFHRVG